jgi:DNA-binding NtrC family response regulator
MLFERRTQHPVVLCVDDDREVLAALRRSLRDEPYEVITALSAAEAMGWLEELPVTLVITDQRMPDVTGTELLRAVGKRWPATARAILTAHRVPSLVTEGLDAGVETFMYKPWDEEYLLETIRRILGNRPG